MTITEQLAQITAALKPWADDVKARVEIAADAVHLLGILATSPGSPRVVVMFDAEEKFGEYEELAKVTRKFMVIVSRGRGFKLDPGAALTEGVAGGKPLYQIVEEVRETLRAIVFDRESTNGIPDYLSTTRFALEENAVDAYQINLAIITQLPTNQEESIED